MYTLEQQLEVEKMYKTVAEDSFFSKLNQDKQEGNYSRSSIGKGIIKQVMAPFTKNIHIKLQEVTLSKKGVKPKYYAVLKKFMDYYINDMDTFVNTLALQTIKVVVNNIATNRKNCNMIASVIGTELQDEVELYAFMHTVEHAETRYSKDINKRVGRSFKKNFILHAYQGNDFVFPKFKKTELTALGMEMIAILTESVDFFYIAMTGEKGLLELHPSDMFLQAVIKSEENIMSRTVKLVPTIIPPKAWKGIFEGGYYGALGIQNRFMRHHPYMKGTKTLSRYLARLNELDLTPIYRAVNRIQNTAYHINSYMLDVVGSILESGGNRAGIPQMKPYEKLPAFPYGDKEIEESEELQVLFKEHKKKMITMIHKENQRQGKALRCTMVYKLAKDFSRFETIYFPMNIDFRGRIYPIPTGLNPQGDDMTKGLLEYAFPKAVSSEDSLQWLMIHGAGLAGHDKICLDERVQWVQDNKDNIVNSVDNPIGYTWWQEQDKPFQFLAWCREYVNALAYMFAHNGSLIGFECHCVIAYDGTCSGLQHYSALLRDPVGGSAVNLVDHDKPSDIYQEVANKVLISVENDSHNGTIEDTDRKGNKIPGTKAIAEAWLAHGITRKVCKRPVMTLAYGSGQYGFGDQIFEDTTKDNPFFNGVGDFRAARYMASKVWDAVQTTVVSATQGMSFLKNLANELASDNMPVEWITPLGLPVQQMYLDLHTECFRLRFGGASVRYRIYVTEPKEGEDTDKKKQVSGVAPNFIHSLDATHLMMSVNACENVSNFTTVHDSFGTSLGEAEELREVIRQQMVKLYSENEPLKDFKAHAEELLGKHIDIDLPQKGTLDINSILSSKFVFH